MSLSPAAQSADASGRAKWSRRSFEQSVGLRLGVSAMIAVCLIVPESEIRAKLFKANLILHSVLKARH